MKRLTRTEENELIFSVFNMLAKSGRRLSLAESFTGGMIADALISIPGASAFFYEGVVAYDERAKINRLRVAPETIKRHGAVSVECAYEMAAGLLGDDNADIAVATTGYAGPSAPENKAGLCFIAVGDRKNIHIYRHQLSGGRENIMRLGLQIALTELREMLKEINKL